MRVFIAGIDGYLGWSLALHLKARGHEVAGLDNGSRRRSVESLGSESVIPIDTSSRRRTPIPFESVDLKWGIMERGSALQSALTTFRPDVVVHLAEQPSATFSMLDAEHSIATQENNVIGTLRLLHAMQEACPDAHLLKLGSMGEYGTPDIQIPEGFFDVEYRGRKATLPFPKQASSWYHWSKVHDSNNIMFACKLWGLRSTDVMQGVVFGTRIEAMGNDPNLATRFDIDECFGTVVNRFCAQATIGHPLTVYGTGQQQRGFLPLQDSINCLTLAIENPPAKGEYRVFNQFENVYSIVELAKLVQHAGREIGLRPEIEFLENPRMEAASHFYQPDHEKLIDLGYEPTKNIEGVIIQMLLDLKPHKERIESLSHVLRPKIRWQA